MQKYTNGSTAKNMDGPLIKPIHIGLQLALNFTSAVAFCFPRNAYSSHKTHFNA